MCLNLNTFENVHLKCIRRSTPFQVSKYATVHGYRVKLTRKPTQNMNTVYFSYACVYCCRFLLKCPNKA